MNYINKVAPRHCKTSCSDESPNNARYAPDDLGGCYRCTLIAAYTQGIAAVLELSDAVQSPLTSKKFRAKAARIQVPLPEYDRKED